MNDKQTNLHASVMCALCVSCVSHVYILRMKVERTEWKTVFSLLLYILVLALKIWLARETDVCACGSNM